MPSSESLHSIHVSKLYWSFSTTSTWSLFISRLLSERCFRLHSSYCGLGSAWFAPLFLESSPLSFWPSSFWPSSPRSISGILAVSLTMARAASSVDWYRLRKRGVSIGGIIGILGGPFPREPSLLRPGDPSMELSLPFCGLGRQVIFLFLFFGKIIMYEIFFYACVHRTAATTNMGPTCLLKSRCEQKSIISNGSWLRTVPVLYCIYCFFFQKTTGIKSTHVTLFFLFLCSVLPHLNIE